MFVLIFFAVEEEELYTYRDLLAACSWKQFGIELFPALQEIANCLIGDVDYTEPCDVHAAECEFTEVDVIHALQERVIYTHKLLDQYAHDFNNNRGLNGDGGCSFLAAYRAVKCRLIWHFRGQALLLRILHVVACDNVRDCVFFKDDLNRVKKGLSSYELNFSLPTKSQIKLTELN